MWQRDLVVCITLTSESSSLSAEVVTSGISAMTDEQDKQSATSLSLPGRYVTVKLYCKTNDKGAEVDDLIHLSTAGLSTLVEQ